MEQQEYEILYKLEDNFWWHVGLRHLAHLSLKNMFKGKGLNILDAGCGTGANLVLLEEFGTAVGLDISPDALKYCKHRNLEHLTRGSVTNLPYKDGLFHVVISFDVIYHTQVGDDINALSEFHRVLRDEGFLILNLPAYNFLKSSHDKFIHTKRRYTRAEIVKKLGQTRFIIQKATYRNTFLFPLLLIIRFFKRIFPSEQSDLKPLPHRINDLFVLLLKFENRILQLMNFPFGSSVYCVVKKEGVKI
ncbi:class I SAM-dependent methyltransferase [Candidatus Marinimicrobia bacterium MT.SAG.3]|nr:class I SAM-dependent methyltransferase [Candidatus Marinimicrobia bacterium MT.SAG.3]